MAASLLAHANCFNPGAELWVLPDLSHSKLTLKVDWYLGFQLSQAELRVPQQKAAALREILIQTEVPTPTISVDNKSGHLIPSLGSLPCRWILMVPFDELKTWVESAHQSWLSLQKPSVRFFLPTGQTAGSFQEVWQTKSHGEDCTIVVD